MSADTAVTFRLTRPGRWQFPLPGGEGQGEGERNSNISSVNNLPARIKNVAKCGPCPEEGKGESYHENNQINKHRSWAKRRPILHDEGDGKKDPNRKGPTKMRRVHHVPTPIGRT